MGIFVFSKDLSFLKAIAEYCKKEYEARFNYPEYDEAEVQYQLYENEFHIYIDSYDGRLGDYIRGNKLKDLIEMIKTQKKALIIFGLEPINIFGSRYALVKGRDILKRYIWGLIYYSILRYAWDSILTLIKLLDLWKNYNIGECNIEGLDIIDSEHEIYYMDVRKLINHLMEELRERERKSLKEVLKVS